MPPLGLNLDLKCFFNVKVTQSQVHLHCLLLKTHVRYIGVVRDNRWNSLFSPAWIREFPYKQDLANLIHVFISSRLDCCNRIFSGISKTALQQLPHFQKKAEHNTQISATVKKNLWTDLWAKHSCYSINPPILQGHLLWNPNMVKLLLAADILEQSVLNPSESKLRMHLKFTTAFWLCAAFVYRL